jgi:PilZ domain
MSASEAMGWVGAAEANEKKQETSTADAQKRVFLVPTHAVGLAYERRRAPRAFLKLPLRLVGVAGEAHIPMMLVTRNISSSGVYFLAPRAIEAGSAIDLEVALVDRPVGQGCVQMRTAAHVVRVDETETPGWSGYAASFDDIAFERDDVLPTRTVEQ